MVDPQTAVRDLAIIAAVAGEEWRWVVGFEGMYAVSSNGRVHSMRRRSYFADGRSRMVGGRNLTLQLNVYGYHMVYLTKDGHESLCAVHRLVAESFHGPRPDGAVVRHLNGDSVDNRAENLQYGTVSENARDCVQHGTHPKASRTECPQGHTYTTRSCYVHPRTGYRQCRVCKATYERRRQARIRLERLQKGAAK